MIKITKPICKYDDCELPATHNFRWSKQPKLCRSHAENGMFDIMTSDCKLCKINPTREDYCLSCFYYSFPENVKTRNHKTKENAFMSGLKKVYPELVLDRIIDGGCSRRRPDGLLDLLTHSVIVEIDEDQHRAYDSTCELARLNELFTDLGDRPIIFLRLNPDKYYESDKFVHGCFKKDMTVVIREFERRLKILIDEVGKCREPPNEAVTEIKLFFDSV